MKSQAIFNELNSLDTEAQNPNSINLDRLDSLEIVKLINSEDQKCALEITKHLSKVAEAIDLVAEKFKLGGRLIYIGAGTSGRLGVLDASECPPTFGTDPNQIQGIMAGGKEAMFTAQEGSEDEYDQSWLDLQEINIGKNDVLCGIMASGRTPYVIGAIEKAKCNSISTILIACNKSEQVKVRADITICVDSGAEILMGSTRMKAGTTQKMLLNMISTGSMVRIGKVYTNVMVDLQMNSEKLIERSKKNIMMLCDCDYIYAEKLLGKAKGHVKSALIMEHLSCSLSDAKAYLEKHKDIVRAVLAAEEKCS